MVFCVMIAFLDETRQTQSMKEIVDKLGFIKIKNSVKDNIKRIRKQATDWEKILKKDSWGKGLGKWTGESETG